MISYEEALQKIFENTFFLPTETVPLKEALNRVVQEDIFSKIEMPPFDKSAVDGYALNFLDTKNISARLKCIGLIQAGEDFKKKLSRGECVKIMTGASLPKDTNSVVMVEDTRSLGEYVTVFKAMARLENVCKKAEDICYGQKVLSKGNKITASEVAILATVGRHQVKVTRKPKVAILNTGGEIVPGGKLLAKGKIYNSNGPMLEALLLSDEIVPLSLGIVKDNAALLKEAILEGLKSDVLLISGGVSMGDYDLIPDILHSVGVKKIFHKVNIKPGKPLFFGLRNKTIVFGIPGNPVSNFLAYLIFIHPALMRMQGILSCEPEFKEGILQREFKHNLRRRHFVTTKISRKENGYCLLPLNSHGSGDTFSLSRADGFMVVDEKTKVLKKNSKAKFITWKKI